ncbi:hypothetical protein L6R49_23510 [Myxococcota bacterium]|nr:hypothetical protein [Myxococcota bacterium]
MTLLRTTSLGLVALLTACGQPAEPQSLAGDVTRLSQDVTRGEDALTATGQLRVRGDDGPHELRYKAVGIPADAPETYTVEVQDLTSGATTTLVHSTEWRTWSVQVADQLVQLAHNPDGSYSVGDQAFPGVNDAARALVKSGALDKITPALLITSTVALADAVLAANTRVPDGYCDPFWYNIDPDCRGWGVQGHAPVQGAYACERWGSESPACDYFEGKQPSR